MPAAPRRAAAAQAPPAAASHFTNPTLRKLAAGGGMAVILILFWLIAYQNLPASVNDMTYKPFDTAGALDRIIKLGALAIGAGIMAARWSVARLLLKNINVGMAAFMVLIPVSALWSIDSGATLLRYTTLAGTVMLCLAIALVGGNRKRFQHVAIPPMMVILIASLVIGALYPEKIIEVGDDISQKNSWHGITHSKNQFGMTASVVAILCFHGWLTQKGRKTAYMTGTAIAFICLVLSRSNTSLLAAVLGMFFSVVMMRIPIIRQRFSTPVVIGIAGTIILYELVIQNVIPGVNVLLAPIMSLTGKDTTFSARSIIWNIIKEHIQAAPLLGTGYGAYWTGPVPTSPSYVFVYAMFFYPTESHNGYLEIMNDLGVVGLVCLFLFVAWYIRQSLELMKYDRAQAVLYLGMLFQQMVANLSESEWFSRSTICNMLLLAAICLSRDLVEYRELGRVAEYPAIPIASPAVAQRRRR